MRCEGLTVKIFLLAPTWVLLSCFAFALRKTLFRSPASESLPRLQRACHAEFTTERKLNGNGTERNDSERQTERNGTKLETFFDSYCKCGWLISKTLKNYVNIISHVYQSGPEMEDVHSLGICVLCIKFHSAHFSFLPFPSVSQKSLQPVGRGLLCMYNQRKPFKHHGWYTWAGMCKLLSHS